MRKGLLSLNIEEYFELDKNLGPHSMQILKELKKRSRNEEVNVSLDYLRQLHNRHEIWLNNIDDVFNTFFKSEPYIRRFTNEENHNVEIVKFS